MSDQLYFDFDAPEISKNHATYQPGQEICFIDPLFASEHIGNIEKIDGNKLIVKTGKRIVTITESQILGKKEQHPLVENEVFGADEMHTEATASSNKKTQAKTVEFPALNNIEFQPFGSYESENKRCSLKERLQYNNEAIELLQKQREMLTSQDINILRRYSGWGGMQADERGVLYDYYTSPPVASFTWRLLNKVQEIKEHETVLEPSCGTGVFFQTAPEGLELHGVELEARTGSIASILNKQAEIFIGSFEQFNLVNTVRFDKVIGNVPFGDRTINTAFMDLSGEKNLDRYFITRSIDAAAPNGSIALIAYSGVLDNASNKEWREEIERSAQFVGAVRLPNSSFNHTHTTVQPDILLFKKYPQDIISRVKPLSQNEFETTGLHNELWAAGTYYRENKQNILGTVLEGQGQWGNDIINGDTKVETLQAALDNFTLRFIDEQIFTAIREKYPEQTEQVSAAVKLTDIEAKAVSDKLLLSGSIKTENGKMFTLTDDFTWRQLTSEDEILGVKIEAVKQIGLQINEIKQYMRAGKNPDELQVQTRKTIEEYKKNYRIYPNKDTSITRFLKNNPSSKGLYEGLLDIDSDILNMRNIYDTGVEFFNGHNPAIETLKYFQNHMIPATVENIEAYFPSQKDSIVSEMNTHQDIFFTHEKQYQLREDFISGNAWDKIDRLAAMQQSVLLDTDTRKKVEYGISELEKAVGWISIEDADFTPHSSWIPENIINQWIEDEYGLNIKDFSRTQTILKTNELGKWGIAYTHDKYVPGKSWRDEGTTIPAHEWVEFHHEIIYYLNMQKQRSRYYDTEIYNTEKNENYKNWVANNTDVRETLEKKYNRLFNAELGVPTKTYPVKLSGWQEIKTLKPHQWQTIHQLYQEQTGISALGTGFGKTLSGIGLISLLRQEGKINRPFIQVPNNKVKDWVEEFNAVMPELKLGYVDPENPEYSNQAKRYEMYHSIATSQYDVIIMPESAASEIQLTPEHDDYITDTVICHHVAEKGVGKSKKQVQKIEEKANRSLQNGKTNKVITFEDFGCDSLFVDEAHRYKNLFTSSLSRETGLNDGRQSNKALSLFKKAEYVRNLNNDKNVFLFTATPLTNSPLEYFNMMMYIAPKELQRLNIYTIDGFIKNFADITIGQKPDWSKGQMTEGKILTGFKNLRMLQDLFFKYTDLQNDPEKINLVKPQALNHPNILSTDAVQVKELKSISEQLDKYKSATKEERELHFSKQNYLTFYSKLRTASLDLELYDPVLYKNWVNPKLERLSQNAKEIYQSSHAGQVIFCDRVFSSDGTFNEHDKIKKSLITQGFKDSEIIIVNGFTKSGAAQNDSMVEREISAAVSGYNSGKYKIMIGSTACIGEGLNLQKNSAALHHFDIPYRPSDFIQRNGRIDRQGNAQNSVELHTYLASGTIDNYSVGLVQSKSNWINKLLKTKSNVFLNPNDDTFFNPDELLLALTEEWGDKNKAQDRRTEMERIKTEKENELLNKKRIDMTYSLSLMRSSLQNFAGDKGTMQYQNRIRKIHSLETSLTNNRTFHNHEILNCDVQFLYNKNSDMILRKGDLLIHNNLKYKVESLDNKKQQLTLKRIPVEGESFSMYSRPEDEKIIKVNDFSEKPVKRTFYHERKIQHYIPNPTEVDMRIFNDLGTQNFNLLDMQTKTEQYSSHLNVCDHVNLVVPVITEKNKFYELKTNKTLNYGDKAVNFLDTKYLDSILMSAKNISAYTDSDLSDALKTLSAFDTRLYEKLSAKIKPYKEIEISEKARETTSAGIER